MIKKLTLLGALVVALVFSAVPAAAITDGELDGNAHPYVGLMVAQDEDGNPLWRCSGTLISARVFITAGHCTEAPAVHVEIWFQADVQSGLATNGYPYIGQTGGTPYTHPDYDPNAFFYRDLGVVLLDANRAMRMRTYGQLPKEGILSTLAAKGGKQGLTFTAVGYGLQQSFPDAASWKESALRVRMVAYPKLNQIDGGLVGDFSILLSNNAHTGGTCFGDSGGPNFIGSSNVIGGVTSFGLNGNCAGTGGVYRLDTSWNLDWIYAEFGKYL